MIQRPASQGGASASQRLLPCVVMFCWHRASPLGKPTSYWKQNHFMFQFIVICLCFSDWGIKYVLFWRLRKDLKSLFVVHPAWYVRALITVIKPFIRWAQMIISLANRAKKGHTHYSYLKPSVWTICFLSWSEKFSRKMRFIHSLQELAEFVPVAQLQIPDSIRQWVSTSSHISALSAYHYLKTWTKYIYIHTHYIAKSIGSPPSNERFDYCSNFHEYKS